MQNCQQELGIQNMEKLKRQGQQLITFYNLDHNELTINSWPLENTMALKYCVA